MSRQKEDLFGKWVDGKEEAVKAAAKKGATNLDLANLLGCGLTTVKKLKRDYPAFAELVKVGREIADNLVENALFKRATGYDYEETITEVRLNKDGSGTTTYVKKVKKHVPPETAASLAWLFNRRPKDWTNQSYRKKDDEEGSANPFFELMKAASRECVDVKEKIDNGT